MMVGCTDATLELISSLSKSGITINDGGKKEGDDMDKDAKIKELENEIEDYKEEFNRVADICDELIEKYTKLKNRVANLEKQNRKIRERQGKADKRIKEVKKYVEIVEDTANNTATRLATEVIRRENNGTKPKPIVDLPFPYKTWYGNNSVGDGIPRTIKHVNFDKDGDVSNFEFYDGNGNVVSVG